MRKVARLVRRLDQHLDKICTVGLLICLSIMIGFTLINMILRWFNSTLIWVEPAVRQLVFLSAFLGGAIATGSKSHIAIDLAGRILDILGWQVFKKQLDRVILLFCLIAVVWLTYAGYQLVVVEIQYGKVEFLNIHSSVLVGIVPFGLILIAFRYINLILMSFYES